jgi:uncharacterized protein YciI
MGRVARRPRGGIVKYLVFYESPPELDRAKIEEHVAAHRARWAEFRDQGTLLAIGPMEDPHDGALAVFTTREAAEEFVAGDPFVLHQVVIGHRVTGWNEVLLEPR